MLMHLALLAEILVTIVCFHCIYATKIEWDIKTITLFLSVLFVLEIINYYQINGMFSFLVYIFFYLYCKYEFHSRFGEIIISLLLYTVIITFLQFICMLVANIVIPEQLYLRNIAGNLLIVFLLKIIFPTRVFHKLQKAIYRNKSFIIGVCGCIALLVLFQIKSFYVVQMRYFVLVVPVLFMLLYFILKWYDSQSEVENMENEIHELEESAKKYENMIQKIRLRQHELKNHMTAIFSTHYTYKTYEKLVAAQEQYCQQVMNENKYNNLLLLENNILVGYLYSKFQEAEDDGIALRFSVGASVHELRVPIYHVIEMLGILFDNAVEALHNSTDKEIVFEVYAREKYIEFIIKNPYPYVSYDDISKWFRYENSVKGSGRGLGLYHLAELCEQWDCEIGCNNEEMNEKNWIVFTLKIAGTDNE